MHIHFRPGLNPAKRSGKYHLIQLRDLGSVALFPRTRWGSLQHSLLRCLLLRETEEKEEGAGEEHISEHPLEYTLSQGAAEGHISEHPLAYTLSPEKKLTSRWPPLD